MNQHLHSEYKKTERLLVLHQKLHLTDYVRAIRNARQLDSGKLSGEAMRNVRNFSSF